MDYYEKKRRAGTDLSNWINNTGRDKFSELVRRSLFSYGFDHDTMLRLLEKNFLGLTIKDDKLVKA